MKVSTSQCQRDLKLAEVFWEVLMRCWPVWWVNVSRVTLGQMPWASSFDQDRLGYTETLDAA